MASVYRASIIVTAHLVRPRTIANDLTRETIYCIGLNDGSAPSTIGSIKSAATDGSSSVGAVAVIPITSTYPLKVNLTFIGLAALQSYAVYCYVESSAAEGTTLGVVLSTKVVVSTLCCRTLTYSNAPSFVFGAVSKYIGTSPSLYVFTYALSAPPSVAIKVTPALSLNGVTTTNVAAIPSSSNFLNTSQLTGSFILSASALINGTLTIMLSVTGLSSAQFYNTSSTVQVLSSYSLVPPPVMVSSQFSDSGQAVVITFDTLTDSAGIVSASWPCSSLFNFTGANFTTCTWTTASTVTMKFNVYGMSNDGYLSPGNIVTMRSGRLRAYCTATPPDCAKNTAAASTSKITLSPRNPSAPTVILNSPLSLGPCANLPLDATGSYGNGGRLYTSVRWTVSAVTDSISINVTNLQSYLNDYSSRYQVSRPITVLPQKLTRASYRITLTLMNFFGLKSFTTIAVNVTADRNLPSVSVIGPSYRSMVASSPLTILSATTLSSCADGLSKVTFSWSVSTGSNGVTTSIKSSSLDPSKFYVTSYALTVDTTYTVTVTALTGAASASASTIVYVAHGVVTAAILGGYTRSVPLDQPLTLDASFSSDSDFPTSSVSALSYKVIRNLFYNFQLFCTTSSK